MVKGRADLFLRVEIIKKVVGICILIVVMNFSVKVMAAGNVASSLIALVINAYYSKQLIGYGIGKQLKDIAPCLVLSIVSCAPAFVLSQLFTRNGVVLLVSIVLAIAIYLLFSYVLKIDEFVQVKSSLAAILQNRNARQ